MWVTESVFKAFHEVVFIRRSMWNTIRTCLDLCKKCLKNGVSIDVKIRFQIIGNWIFNKTIHTSSIGLAKCCKVVCFYFTGFVIWKKNQHMVFYKSDTVICFLGLWFITSRTCDSMQYLTYISQSLQIL